MLINWFLDGKINTFLGIALTDCLRFENKTVSESRIYKHPF